MIKKIIKNNYKILLGLIIGTTLTVTGAYAAVCINAGDISFTSHTGLNSTNLQDAIDNLAKKTENYEYIRKCNGSNCPKCIRGKFLHSTDTMTFGNSGTEGILSPGDSFDCDVNGDGIYEPWSERFYYVTDLAENNNYAVLMYYSNIVEGIPIKNRSMVYDNTSNPRSNGPRSAVNYLPTNSQWINVALSNINRTITDQLNNTYCTFAYKNEKYVSYTARLLTYQEVVAACPNASGTTESLNSCTWLLENSKYSDDASTYGYWLENVGTEDSSTAWVVSCSDASLGTRHVNGLYNNYGVRPAIEVLKTDITY